MIVKRLLVWIKKPRNGFIFDKRNTITCVASSLMVIFAIAWFMLTAAIAETLPATRGEALTQTDLIRAQWWLIGGLIGFVLIVGQGFIIYVVNGVKQNVRDLFQLHSKVLTVESHERIDHSQLCAICRTANISLRRRIGDREEHHGEEL